MTGIKKQVWVYDIEQFRNFHCNTFKSRDNPMDIRQFAICESRNDSKAYSDFLNNEVLGLIGFNNINYDYPMLHFLMEVFSGYPLDTRIPDWKMLNELLYDESQRIISAEYSAVSKYDDKYKIQQLDVYLIHHFNNKAKATSLKAVEIAIRFPNVQDLPYDPDHEILFDEEDKVLEYNLNDVEATYEFYLLTKDLVELRKKLGKKYNIDLINANDPKIGQEIFGRQIARKKGWKFKYLKDMRTYRHFISLKDCIIDKVQFRTKEFNILLDDLKSTVVEGTYKAFEKSVIYKGFKYDYGTGGIHGCIEPGIYNEDDEYILIDIDVKN